MNSVRHRNEAEGLSRIQKLVEVGQFCDVRHDRTKVELGGPSLRLTCVGVLDVDSGVLDLVARVFAENGIECGEEFARDRTLDPAKATLQGRGATAGCRGASARPDAGVEPVLSPISHQSH